MQYKNVPRYEDSAYSILLYKEQARPYIDSFAIDPQTYTAYIDPYQGNGYLEYQTYGAPEFKLNIAQEGKGPVLGYPQLGPL